MTTTKLCTVKEEHSGAACHVAHDTGIQVGNSQYPNLVTPSNQTTGRITITITPLILIYAEYKIATSI